MEYINGNRPQTGQTTPATSRPIVGSSTVNNFNRMDSNSDDQQTSIEDRIRSMSFSNLDESDDGSHLHASTSSQANNPQHGAHQHYGLSKLKSNFKKGFEKLFNHSTSITPSTGNNACHSKKTASNKTLNENSTQIHKSNTSINSVNAGTDHRGSIGANNGSSAIRGLPGNNYPYQNQPYNHSTSMPDDQNRYPPRSQQEQQQQDGRSRSGSKDNVLSAAEASGLLCIYRPPPAVPRPPYKDDPHLADLKKRLVLLDPPTRLGLQRRAYDLLVSQVEEREIELAKVKSEIHQLNQELLKKNEAIRSVHEIETLKDDIRNLTNEKAHLEQLISKNNGWSCKTCTYLNQDESIECVMCTTERDDEIFICNHCQTKNSLNKTSCRKCHAYFGADNSQPFLIPCRPPPPPPGRAAHQRHQRTPSSSSNTNNNSSSYNLLFMINHNDSSDSGLNSMSNGNHSSSSLQQTPSPTSNLLVTPSTFTANNYQQPSIPFVPPSKKSGSPLNQHPSTTLLPSPSSYNGVNGSASNFANHANNLPRAQSTTTSNNVR